LLRFDWKQFRTACRPAMATGSQSFPARTIRAEAHGTQLAGSRVPGQNVERTGAIPRGKREAGSGEVQRVTANANGAREGELERMSCLRRHHRTRRSRFAAQAADRRDTASAASGSSGNGWFRSGRNMRKRFRVQPKGPAQDSAPSFGTECGSCDDRPRRRKRCSRASGSGVKETGREAIPSMFPATPGPANIYVET
jgi:hypothetical protein